MNKTNKVKNEKKYMDLTDSELRRHCLRLGILNLKNNSRKEVLDELITAHQLQKRVEGKVEVLTLESICEEMKIWPFAYVLKSIGTSNATLEILIDQDATLEDIRLYTKNDLEECEMTPEEASIFANRFGRRNQIRESDNNSIMYETVRIEVAHEMLNQKRYPHDGESFIEFLDDCELWLKKIDPSKDEWISLVSDLLFDNAKKENDQLRANFVLNYDEWKEKMCNSLITIDEKFKAQLVLSNDIYDGFKNPYKHLSKIKKALKIIDYKMTETAKAMLIAFTMAKYIRNEFDVKDFESCSSQEKKIIAFWNRMQDQEASRSKFESTSEGKSYDSLERIKEYQSTPEIRPCLYCNKKISSEKEKETQEKQKDEPKDE